MKYGSRTKNLATAALLAFAIALINPLTQTVFAFLNPTCVTQTKCGETAPPGKYCSAVSNVPGSTAQNDGVAATSSSCSYVYNGSNPGTACGSAVPDIGSN